MRTITLARLCIAATLTAGVALSATTAWATDSTTPLQAVKEAAHTAVAARIGDLNKALAVVNGATDLGADQASLVGALDTDLTGLGNLDQTIQADSTLAAARADTQKIYTDFRIYALVIPATHMTVAADALTNVAEPKLSEVATTLQNLITETGATAEQATLDDMKTQIAAAQTATSGLAAQLMGFTPAQWNANHELLSPSRAQLKTARTDLEKARQDAKSIVAAVQAK